MANGVGVRRPTSALPVAAGLAVVVSLAATGLTFQALRRDEQLRLRESFARRSAERGVAVQRSLDAQVELVHAVVALQVASEEVTRREFAAFAAPLLERHPQVQALEWVPVVPGGDRAAREAEWGVEWSGFRIRERNPDGALLVARDREVHYPVVFVEPLAGNEQAVGFDLASDPDRHDALLAARDTGRAVLTAPIELVQRGGAARGALIVMAFYGPGGRPLDVEERRRRLSGFGIAVIHGPDLLGTALAGFDPTRISVTLLDRSAPPERRVLAAVPQGASRLSLAAGARALRTELRIAAGDRDWLLACVARPEFVRSETTVLPWVALGAGLVLTAILGAFIAVLVRHSRRYETLATVDPLTGVLNRRGLEAALERVQAASREVDRPAAALLVNYDDFRAFNQAFGHGVGDAVLTELSRRLAAGLSGEAELGRVGGDEFLVLLPHCSSAEAWRLAEKLRRRLSSAPVIAVPRAVTVTASIGVTEVTERSASLSQVLAWARTGLNQSKTSGKNRSTLALTTAPAAPPADAEAALRAALDGSGLNVHWEPLVRLSDGAVMGHELLVRGPAGPYEAPGELFRLATENEMLTALDLACVRACVVAAARAEVGGDLHLNLLPSTLLNVPVDAILRELDRARVGHRVCLEINEQQFISHPSYLKEVVGALRAAGLRIAVDDVGTGHGTLDSVLVLHPDVVKIDLTLVQGVSEDVEKERQLERLVQVCRSLGIEMIAEGIETAADRDHLAGMGIQLGQGYLWPVRSKPERAGVPGPAPDPA